MDPIISAITEELVKVIVENAIQELRHVTCVGKEVKMLRKNLEHIESVLEEAEQTQRENGGVRRCKEIERLKEVADDMDDVLDEWNTAILKMKIDRKEVCSFFSCFACCRQVVWRHDIATKIKEINEKVDVIARDRYNYQLAKSTETNQPRRLESSSFVDVSKLHGRDEVKNDIVSTLLGGNDIQTISIVGMRGIGKTALAQLIFHDAKVGEHFNKIIWVCVSGFFAVNKIALAILRNLDPSSTILQNPISLEQALIRICEQIESTKFLLVLDDLWTGDYGDWEPLKAVFRKGMSGSRILVTTHKKSVATEMASSEPCVFDLKELSDEECWVILSQEAFVGSRGGSSLAPSIFLKLFIYVSKIFEFLVDPFNTRDQDSALVESNNERQNLEDIGREIVKKCKGLPRAAKTLGVLLRGKNNSDEWQGILEKEMWNEKKKKNIFKPLLLSCYDLPSQIRPCLLYCAIFSKDFVFWRTELIKHWMAHGYLGMEENNGEEYFKELASRSFFQDFEKDGDGNIIKCKMHDSVHDFVQYLTEKEIVDLRLGSFEKARHLRVMITEKGKFPESINGIEKLRSLVTNGKECDHDDALQNLFKGAKCLRLLEFAMDWKWYSHACVGIRKIPNEIGALIHLRYLNFSWSFLKELPEEVCELHNLQYLNFYDCKDLMKLPEGIGKLINLRSLNTRKCNILECYPKGISRLISLTELTSVKATVDDNDTKKFSVGDLEKLDNLCGDIEMSLVGHEFKVKDAERAKLGNKHHLNLLVIDVRGCPAVDDLEDVRKALKPPEWLKVERWSDPEE